MNTEEYITAHSDIEPEYLAKLNRITHLRMINPRMLSGHYQGRVLAMFCHMIQPKTVLEIGTFTGYSAICMAEGMPEDGVLHTIDYDEELENFLKDVFAGSEHGHKIKLHIGDALTVIASMNETFDLVFIDADKEEYQAYFEAVLPKVRPGGYLLVDNTLWDGKVLKPVDPKDKETIAIMKFNETIAKDARIEKVLLPVRDGLTLIRKIG
ncbi:MAG: class I SAM-dependent methyltransferase [Paludibacter sp.]|nr:class I SAM-dependent methyltransferase [Paludibacter sp.]